LQDNIVHGSRQARRPILLFQLLGRSRWSVQRADGKRAANGQRCKGSDPGFPMAIWLLAWPEPLRLH
jgi:hypothetical protein